jgi:hypothetical protein
MSGITLDHIRAAWEASRGHRAPARVGVPSLPAPPRPRKPSKLASAQARARRDAQNVAMINRTHPQIIRLLESVARDITLQLVAEAMIGERCSPHRES